MNTRRGEVPDLAGEYGIADMTCFPWMVPLPKHGTPLDRIAPNVAAWVARVGECPAIAKAVAWKPPA